MNLSAGSPTHAKKPASRHAHKERVYATLIELGADPCLIASRGLPLFADANRFS